MKGAREVRDKVLKTIDDSKLVPFIVWLPRYPGDTREGALKSKKLVKDTRASFFWDGMGALGERYGQVIDLPNKRRFAWDVYLLFDKQTEWKSEPPQPTFWMHQLGDDARRLDGEKLRQEVERLLQRRNKPN